ncbi:MAG: anhydro-N-acetylmuramic acid kinase [Schleiferiaceae bacterium]|nr:anhydro-N-acetylmuramic acid kinase [Schleiferiaceae bacterium]
MHGPIIALGSMSGTSLDGLDLALVKFTPPSKKINRWRFSIISSNFISYSGTRWEDDLLKAYKADANELDKISRNYSKWVSFKASEFISSLSYDLPKVFCSHGHTVKHSPENGVTQQIGNTHELTTHLNIPVVCDFRSADVRRGGQGAPLVPIADKLLFSDQSICLNLGGFANASWDENELRLAADLGPCNIILNELMRKMGKPYDDKGELSSRGQIDPKTLEKLNNLSYYSSELPKSLSREWAEENIMLEILRIPKIEDALATAVEHAAWAINFGLEKLNSEKIFVTGGGVWNTYLMKRIAYYWKKEIQIPEKQIVNQKEALCFAFLGIRRLRGEINILSSVTGGAKDSCDGTVFEKYI